MNTDQRNMSAPPRKRQQTTASAPANGNSAAAAGEDIFTVPFTPVRAKQVLIGDKPVMFRKPKMKGVAVVSKNGKVFADAQALAGGDLAAVAESIGPVIDALRELVPYMVRDQGERAWVLECFDRDDIEDESLVRMLIAVLSYVMQEADLSQVQEPETDDDTGDDTEPEANGEAETDQGPDLP